MRILIFVPDAEVKKLRTPIICLYKTDKFEIIALPLVQLDTVSAWKLVSHVLLLLLALRWLSTGTIYNIALVMTGPLKPKIGELIALLIGERSEAHPLEKHIALGTFCTWLYDPDDDKVLEHATIVSAANIFRRCKDVRADTIPLSKQQLACALADPPLATDFVSYFTNLESSMDSLTNIVSFFMFCPDNIVPSLNKAFHFIEEGGFVDRSQSAEDQRELLKLRRRKSTLKALWKERAHTAPFVWSANFKLPEILELAPDDANIFKTTEKLLKKPEKLRRYFETVQWCQDRLQNNLEPSARRKIIFHKLPETLPGLRPNIGKFDRDQLKIISSYRHK